ALPSPLSSLFPYTTLFRSPWLFDKRLCLCFWKPSGLLPAVRNPGADQLPADVAGWRWHASPDLPGGAGYSAAPVGRAGLRWISRSEEHTSELQSRENLVCR